MEISTPFILTIERIIPGGRGLAFHGGKAVFVPLTVPGDRVNVRQARDRKSYIEVIESDIVEGSPERTDPSCPYFAVCGGCDFQQMTYERQLEAKREILLDTLQHIGKIKFSSSQIRIHPSPPTRYRNRLQLKLMQSDKKWTWGFYKMRTHEVCGVDSCTVASPLLWEELKGLLDAIQSIPAIRQQVQEVEVLLGDDQQCLVTMSLLDVGNNLSLLAQEFSTIGKLQERPRLHIRLCTPNRNIVVSGDGFIWKTVGEFKYRVSHGAFFQINDPMLLALRSIATQHSSGERALELFCGIGFFTLPLAQRFKDVQAIDVNSSAISDLTENLKRNKTTNVKFLQQDLSHLFESHGSGIRDVDLLLIDPPRTGLPQQIVEEVVSLKAGEFVYVSCDPSTLARDLRILRGHNYEIVSLDLLDLFPQTHHLESVVRLKRC